MVVEVLQMAENTLMVFLVGTCEVKEDQRLRSLLFGLTGDDP